MVSGYVGWENLSNPDVYRVEVSAPSAMGFCRLWDPSRIG